MSHQSVGSSTSTLPPHDAHVSPASPPSLLSRLVRYLAYTSDVGEAFRPIVPLLAVRSCYGISWGYVVGDVAYEGYQASNHRNISGPDLRRIMIERCLFQSFASMIFPAITIHETVRLTKRHVFPRIQKGRFMQWGPTFCGLAVIPFLPFMYDYPVETACEAAFDKFWPFVSPEGLAAAAAAAAAHNHH